MAQYVNKVVFGSDVKIDLTSDTVTSDTLASGTTAHDKSGTPITGTLSFRNLYTSTSEPTSTDGSVGDIWIVTTS